MHWSATPKCSRTARGKKAAFSLIFKADESNYLGSTWAWAHTRMCVCMCVCVCVYVVGEDIIQSLLHSFMKHYVGYENLSRHRHLFITHFVSSFMFMDLFFPLGFSSAWWSIQHIISRKHALLHRNSLQSKVVQYMDLGVRSWIPTPPVTGSVI